MPDAPKKEKFSKQDLATKIERPEYEILERVITVGRAMRSTGLSARHAEEAVNAGLHPRHVIPRPATVQEGYAVLKAALKEAVEINPAGLVMLACKNQILAAATEHSLDVDEVWGTLTKILQERYSTENLHAKFSDRKAPASVEELRDWNSNQDTLNLEAREDLRIVSMTEGKNALSSNCFEYWDPAAGGLLPHIKHYTSKIGMRLVMRHLRAEETKLMEHGYSSMSFEGMAAAGVDVADIDGSPRTVRRSKGAFDNEGETEGVEEEQESEIDAYEAERAAEEARKAEEEEEDPLEEGRTPREDDDLKDELKDEPLQDLGVFTPTKPFDPTDAAREDLIYVAGILRQNNLDPIPLEQAVTPELRNLELKRAVALIVEQCPQIPDQEELLRMLSMPESEEADGQHRWDPNKHPLWSAQGLPEFYDYFLRTGGEMRVEVEESETSPGAVSRLQEHIVQPIQPAREMTPEERQKQAKLLREEAEMWRMHAPEEGLAAGERADYRFLARHTGQVPKGPEDEVEFVRAIRKMAATYLGERFEHPDPAMAELKDEFLATIAKWDPMEHYFSEVVVEKLEDLAVEGRITEKHALLVREPLSREAVARQAEIDKLKLLREQRTVAMSDRRKRETIERTQKAPDRLAFILGENPMSITAERRDELVAALARPTAVPASAKPSERIHWTAAAIQCDREAPGLDPAARQAWIQARVEDLLRKHPLITTATKPKRGTPKQDPNAFSLEFGESPAQESMEDSPAPMTH